MLFSFALVASLVAQAAESYSFAVVPQYEQRKLFQIWKPIVNELSKRTGLELRLVTPLTVAEYERDLVKGTFDFIYVNPYQIVYLNQRPRYIPLVHDKLPLRGIVVVSKDSPFKSPADLNGKTLAIPSYNALGASLMARADLERLFKAKMTPVVVKTHSSVYLSVANGLTAAGGGVEKTLQQQEPEVRDMLRVLYTTRDMPSHPVAAHQRIPAEAREKVKRAFLDLATTNAGRAMLAEVPMTEVVPTSIAEFLPLRKWGLDAYWVD
ncbi:MAG TPA: phosphate/phosphite/phosphonate ABC transporter substrate-binding protein [Rhodocyclaceae bacterium]|nr:phosphate/phosphite/phosphonate ABC transporter substrate-binding protein [Rhodocyclaceae bacterium]